MSDAASSVTLPDRADQFVSEFCSAVFHAMWHSSLGESVSYVVQVTPKKHMIGIHASRVISSRAVMADENTIGNISDQQLIGHSMSKSQFSARSTVGCTWPIRVMEMDSAISIFSRACTPKPAGSGFVHLGPKAMSETGRVKCHDLRSPEERGYGRAGAMLQALPRSAHYTVSEQ